MSQSSYLSLDYFSPALEQDGWIIMKWKKSGLDPPQAQVSLETRSAH